MKRGHSIACKIYRVIRPERDERIEMRRGIAYAHFHIARAYVASIAYDGIARVAKKRERECPISFDLVYTACVK